MQPAAGSHQSTRIGRGIGSGKGKTSARGHKGQKSRSGGGIRPGFEGGQMPIHRRLPKRGFTNIFKKEIVEVNLAALNSFDDGTVVTDQLLWEAGLIDKIADGVKVLANGDISKKLTVCVACSKGAADKIVAAGGKVEVN